MADLTVSTTVDTFMQAADAPAARTAIAAAALASPIFTGTPAAPTAPPGTNTTQLASTAFVAAAVAGVTPGYTAVANFAALPSAAAHSGETYFVSAAQGVIWVNRKPAGLYTSDGAAWNYDADQTDAYLAGLTPTNGQIPVGNGTNFVTQSVSGDGTLAANGVLTVTKTGGTAFTALATTTPGTGIATALGVNVGSAGAPVILGGALGTPSSGTLTNCTADGTNGVGFKNIPQNSKSAAYTTVLGDAGWHIYHPSADTTARTWTIDSNANVAYPIGTAITFVNDTSAGVITIAITSDTLVLAGTGSTGSRALAANGIATAIKVTSTRWQINGTGLT